MDPTIQAFYLHVQKKHTKFQDFCLIKVKRCSFCKNFEYEDVHVIQDDRDQICLNYVTKGPKVIAIISRKLYCCVLYIVCTIYMFLKKQNKD